MIASASMYEPTTRIAPGGTDVDSEARTPVAGRDPVEPAGARPGQDVDTEESLWQATDRQPDPG